MIKTGLAAFFVGILLMLSGNVAEASQLSTVSEGDVMIENAEIECLSSHYEGDYVVTAWSSIIEDTVIDGNLIVDSPRFFIEGCTVTVNGDVIINQGRVSVTDAKIDVSGDYVVGYKGEIDEATGEYLATSSAYVGMTNSELNVAGDVEICSSTGAYYSTVRIGGDLFQYGNYSTPGSVYAYDDTFNVKTLLEFSDGKNHTICCEGSESQSWTKVDFGNGEITLLGVMGEFDLYEDTVWNLNLPEDKLIIPNWLDLQDYNLTINSDVDFVSGSIWIGTGTLEINGDFSMGKKGAIDEATGYRLATSDAYIRMNSEESKLIVNGDFEVCSSEKSSFNAGTTYIEGDCRVYGSDGSNGGIYAHEYAFFPDVNHKLVFADNKPHSFDADAELKIFSDVDFGQGELEFLCTLYKLQIFEDTVLNLKNEDLRLGSVGFVVGDGHTLTINGNLNLLSGNVNIGDGCLVVKGDLTLGKKGEIDEATGHRLATSSAAIYMEKESAEIYIDGDLVFCTTAYCRFDKGRIYIGGDLMQYGSTLESNPKTLANGKVFWSEDSHRFVLCDGKPHKIYLESQQCILGDIYFGNGEIEFLSDITGVSLAEDTELNLKNKDLGVSGKLHLKGYTLTINGDFNLLKGDIQFSGGCLHVKGDFSIGTEGGFDTSNGYRYATSQGELSMSNERDVLIVEGDMEICSSVDSILSQGTVYLYGDLSQYGTYVDSRFSPYAYNSAFPSNTKHTVVLCGTEPQKIYFEGSRSRFNKLVLTQPMSNYTFNRENCWSTLVDEAKPVLTVEEPSKEGGTLTHTSVTFNIQVDEAADVGVLIRDYKDMATYTEEQIQERIVNWAEAEAGELVTITIENLNPETKYGYMVVAYDESDNVTIYAENGEVADTYVAKTFITPDEEYGKYLGVKAFVERMYMVALGRASDTAGIEYWTEQLVAKEDDAASLSAKFILGEEFSEKNYSNEEYIQVLYSTFFDREADESGKAYWANSLETEKTREEVLAGFVNSDEFFNLCGEYEISRGILRQDGSALNSGIYRFTERLYSEVMEREGEREGIEYWALQLDNQTLTPEYAAMSFFFCEEYVNKKVTDEEYIKTLYRTFMGREADDAGLSHWKEKLSGEVSREEVLADFAQSPEFQEIIAEYGLLLEKEVPHVGISFSIHKNYHFIRYSVGEHPSTFLKARAK